MLPQFPELQLDISRQIMRIIAVRKNQRLGGMGDIPSHHVFEGHHNSITRADGSHDVTEMATATGEVTIKFEEFPTLSLAALIDRHDAIVEQFARAQAEHMFKMISQATAAVGNDIDAQGKPVTADLYLQVLDRLAIDFRPDGSPHMPTLVVHPTMAEQAQAIMDEVQTDPALRARWDAIMTRKYEEWRAGEASRELAG